MKIYTSYFANTRTLAKHGIMPIGIAQWPPKWFSGESLKIVAPPGFLLRGDYTQEQYIDIYRNKVLASLNVDLFLQQLQWLGHGKDVALCCYEKPDDFCHRHLLAEYLRMKGVEVEEFKEPAQEEKTPEPKAPSLFDE